MAKVPLGNLISVMQNCIFTSSSSLAGLSSKANLPAPPRKPPRSLAVQSSEAAKQTIRIYERAEHTEEFFNLFREYGFEDSQIEKLRECTRVSKLSAKILKPKLDFFVENGFSGELLHNLIVSSPYILRARLDTIIKPRFQFLKQFLGSDEKVKTVINRSRRIFTIEEEYSFVSNVELLINEGVPADRVSALLVSQPTFLMQRRDRIAAAVKTVRESGVAPDDPTYFDYIRTFFWLREVRMRKKTEILKSSGWSEGKIFNMVKKGSSGILELYTAIANERMNRQGKETEA